MKTIWKFALKPGLCEFSSPNVALAIHVAEQNGAVCVWAIVDTDAETVQRRLHVVGTGWPLPDFFTDLDPLKIAACHLGTAQIGEFVWHVFEEP